MKRRRSDTVMGELIKNLDDEMMWHNIAEAM
jgi:hypothetical protein